MNEFKGKKQLKGKRLKKKNIALLVGLLLLILCGLWFWYESVQPLRLHTAAPQVEIATDFNPKDNIRSVFMGSPDDVQIEGTVDTATPGTYSLTYIYKDRSYPVQVTVADFTSPILELRPVHAAVQDELDAESFVVKCRDRSKVSLTIDNPENLKNSVGTRDITITALDEFGNKTTRHTQLTRIEDSTTPVVTNKNTDRWLLLYSAFEPADLDIEDNTDIECTVDINTHDLNMDQEGSYRVTYTVTDSSGNSTQWEETVHVCAQLPDGQENSDAS